MSATPEDEPAQLRAELAKVLKREAALRETTTREFLELQGRLQPLTRVIGERGQAIEDLTLREIALRLELERATSDLESFVWMLEAEEKTRAKAEARTPSGWLASWFGALPAPDGSKTPPGDFVYHLTTSPYRIYGGPSFTLRGWAFPRDGRAVTAIRVRLAGREFAGRAGLPAPEAIAQHGATANNPQPGFEVTFDTPPGRHRLALEAQLAGGEWRSILEIPVWCALKR
jgi:hypothetical protein